MYRLTGYGAMVADRRRIDAYSRAISAAVRPESIVLDLGAGIGTFSVLACKAGAKRVYAVESGDVIGLAQDIAQANGVAGRIRFLQQDARVVDLPEKVDVIIADLSGALPLFEDHLPAVMRTRDAFLKPEGVLIPARDRMFCAPLSNAKLYAQLVEPWRSVPGVDLAASETLFLNATHALPVIPEDLAGEPQCWADLDYAAITSPNVKTSLRWEIARPALIHGVALWFESTLFGEIRVASGPWSEGSVHATIVLPLREPQRVAATEKFELAIESTLVDGRYVTTWQMTGGGRQSTFFSELQSSNSLAGRAALDPLDDEEGPPANASYRVADRVLARRVGNELLVFDSARGVYHVLNDTAMKVWKSLECGGVAEIAAALSEEYDVDAETSQRDVAAILLQLQKAALIERA